MEEENAPLTITISGTHGETLTITDDFERPGVLDGELLMHVRGPKGASKYLFTTSRQELARLTPAGTAEDRNGPRALAEPADTDPAVPVSGRPAAASPATQHEDEP
jgi:hypothetical protein